MAIDRELPPTNELLLSEVPGIAREISGGVIELRVRSGWFLRLSRNGVVRFTQLVCRGRNEDRRLSLGYIQDMEDLKNWWCAFSGKEWPGK